MPVVKMPDGQLVELPENPSPQEMAALTQLSQQAPVPQGMGEAVGRRLLAGFGRAAGGLMQGASTLAGTFLPPSGAEAATTPDVRELNPASRALKGWGDRAESYWKDLGDKSTIKGIPAAALEGVGGAATSGQLGLTSLLSGAGAGTGQEVGKRVGGDSAAAQIGGALLGGLAGGVVGSKLSSARPQTAEISREMLEGIDADTLKRAQAFQAEAFKNGAPGGVRVDLAQALEAVGAPAGNIRTVRNFLANRSQGNQVQQTLREQPGQLSMAADLYAGGLPGTNYGMPSASSRLVEASTNLIEEMKKARSAEVRQLYAAAGNMPEEGRKQLITIAQSMMQAPGTLKAVKDELATFIGKLSPSVDSQAARAVGDARKALAEASSPSQRMAAQSQLAAAKAPAPPPGPLHALDVDTALSELTGPYRPTPLNPVDPKLRGQVKGVAGRLNEGLKNASPELAAAERRFSALSGPINQVKAGPVGMMAGRQGFQEGIPTPSGRFEALMQRGTDPSAKVSEIRTLGEQLMKADPEAVPNAVKAYVSSRIKQAMTPGPDSATAANNTDMAQKIAANLFGNELQYQGLKDAVSVSAKSLGQNPTDVVRGLDHLVRLTKAAASRPQGIGGLGQQEIFSMGGKSYGADALRVFGFLPFERAARRMEDVVLSKTLSELDTILTSPQGADMLAKLGKTPVMSKKALTILGTMGGAAGSLDQPGQE